MTPKLGVWFSSLAVVFAMIVVLAGGCGGDDPPPAAKSAGPCTPGAKECVHDTLARLCSPEKQWLAKSCHANEKCVEGDCKADAVGADCKPNTGSCTDATNGFRCRPDLKGFEVVACPPGSTCREGLCIGACTKGSSRCIGTGYVGTCDDARTLVQTACNAGELCVTTSAPGAPVTTAACKPAECTPGASCSRTCGDKVNPQNDQTRSFTDCAATPDGYRYAVTQCAAHESCNPTGSPCGSFGQASCSGDCTPGTMRCSSDRLGTQVCGADGKWASAVTPCNPDPASSSLVCITSDANTNKVVCADAFCAASNVGSTCAGDLVRTCVTGKLGAPAACPNGGVCLPNNQPAVAGLAPGSCSTIQCQAGEERCVLGSYQTCDNGKWSNPVPCPAGPDGGPNQCINTTGPSGLRGKICNAECAPGTRRCRAGDGDAGSDGIQVCDANGRWGATQACSIGTCRTSVVPGAGAACVAECIPNAAVCTGAAKLIVGTTSFGTDSFVTCTATGRLPSVPTACAGETTCRKDATGQAIAPSGNACIECVGPGVANGNEKGQVDRRCVAPGGGPGNTASEGCTASNTWEAPTACAGGAVCSTSNGLCAVRTTFTGVATNVSQGSLQGWTECFANTYGGTANLSTVLAACPGANLMLGCRAAGTDTLITAAHAPRADVTFATTGATTHVANGVGWYYDTSGAWGYAPGAETITRTFGCDSGATSGDQRMCWNIVSTSLLWVGERCGTQTNLFSSTYERVILQAD